MADNHFNIKETLNVMKSHLLGTGLFSGNVQIGEPKTAPTSDLSATILMTRVRVAIVSLTEAREIHEVRIRIYKNMIQDPQEKIEFDIANAASIIMSRLYTDFDLGETTNDIDVGGWYGTPINVEFGYVSIGGDNKLYRIADIDFSIIIDSNELLAA